jgi:hypothetical protein
MKVAIVHDYLNQYGGAERVIEAFHEIFPDAPIFTSIYLPEKLPSAFSTFDVRPSFMQRLPFLDRHFKKYLPLYPFAIEQQQRFCQRGPCREECVSHLLLLHADAFRLESGRLPGA